MARYIDADALQERLREFYDWCRDGRKQGVGFVIDYSLPNTPTADVQEVVRCKYCKFRYTATCFAKHETADDDYCSCGAKNGR